MTVLNILAAVSGITTETLFQKIDFVVTDATSHNLEVEKMLADKLQTDHIPSHLLCHTHPALMFTRELEAVFKEIEEKIGRDKIYAHFNIIPDSPQSVTKQFLDVVSRFISHDFDHKFWNRANEFDLHIHPKKNTSVKMASERFTRFCFLCASVLFHDADVTSFLHKFAHITNNLACIIRGFEHVEFLRILCLVGALIGIHLIEPYVKLTSSCKTTYGDLEKAFPLLHSELLTADPDNFFQSEKPALSFASQEIFDSVKYPTEILESISAACEVFKPRVRKSAHNWQKQECLGVFLKYTFKGNLLSLNQLSMYIGCPKMVFYP